MSTLALGIIDAQRGFMPAEEGARLDRAGFGELPVVDGQRILPVVERMIWAAGQQNVFTTQDWHPERTAHFSDNPDFVNNWPVHCVADSMGALLHPELESNLMPSVARFYKGQEELKDGKDDLSYSGYYATTKSGLALPEWLAQRKAEHVFLGGLALDYCVGKTALDLKLKAGFDVTVVLDATRGIADSSVKAMLEDFDKAGVQTAKSQDVLQDISAERSLSWTTHSKRPVTQASARYL